MSCCCVIVYGQGERHGTPAERLLAAQMRAKQAQQSRPHTLFATGPRQQPQPGMGAGEGGGGGGESQGGVGLGGGGGGGGL
jgi:splicing factor 3B subunit 4